MNLPPRSSGTISRLPLLVAASVLVPTLLGGLVIYFMLASTLDAFVERLARVRDAVVSERLGPDLAAQARNVADQLDTFLLERIYQAKAWASSDVVVTSAREAYQRHVDSGFADAEADDLEERFRISKSLGAFPEADAYLRQQVAVASDFAEAFFTDRLGYNVALTNPTSDFIQSDEGWWLAAWSHEIAVGDVEYDNSAGVWSLDIAIRIDDPADQTPLGVLKTVLSISPVQRIADRSAESLPGSRVVVATGEGLPIAETVSRHARERIMSKLANVRVHGTPGEQSAFGAERSAFSVSDGFLTAHARTAGADLYTSVVPRFRGFDWIIILQRPLDIVLAPVADLPSTAVALSDASFRLVVSLASVVVLAVLVAFVVPAVAFRRWVHDVEAMTAFVRGVIEGNAVRRPVSPRVKELADLEASVYQLYRALAAALHRMRAQAQPPAGT